MIDTREIAAEYRLSHWAGVIGERAESGLTVKAFCESAGLHPNTHFYWQRKLREAACGEMIVSAAPPAPGGWAVAGPGREWSAHPARFPLKQANAV